MNIDVVEADQSHLKYAITICEAIESAAKLRGTGIAKRDPAYIEKKMKEHKAVIALCEDGTFAGFSYLETWEHGQYVATSGLIVVPEFRQGGLAKRIKAATFAMSRKKYPDAKIFSITTSLPVMKMNTALGYKPVTFSELTKDEIYWKGCQGCVNFDILQRTNYRMCLCYGMLYDPAWEKENKPSQDIDNKQDK